MKTAMQELIQSILNSNPDVKIYDLQNILRRDMNQYLKKERGHLIDVYNEGWLNGTEFPTKNHIQAEDYYNETFK